MTSPPGASSGLATSSPRSGSGADHARRRTLGVVAASLALITASFSGCTTASTSCDCPTSQITIDIPADIASSFSSADVHLSGAACTNVTLDCANPTNGCTAYDFTPNAAGECDVEIDKPSGVFTATLTIVAQSGCCAGMYTAASTTVDVPEPEDGG
jgi:hypothetical protein